MSATLDSPARTSSEAGQVPAIHDLISSNTNTKDESGSRLKVLIVGAGVAGLATGAGLRAFADVTILESATILREVGAALSLGPNANAILTNVLGGDLHDPYGGVDSEGMRDFNGLTGEVGFEHLVDYVKAFGSAFTSVHRRDLQAELMRLATRPDGPGKPCEIILGARVANVDCNNATVTTTDGITHTSDLIIGADGIKSTIRSTVLGHEVPLVPSGYSAYRTTIPSLAIRGDEELLKKGILERRITLFSTETKRVVSYMCQDGETVNLVCIVPDTDLVEATAATWTATSDHTALVRAYDEFHPMWKRLLSLGHTPGVWQLTDTEVLDTWVKGRCLLIGDAVHAMLPFFAQGASQSIEDAEAVIFCLSALTSSDPSNIHTALARVQSIRQFRAARVQTASRQCGFGVPGTTGKNGVVFKSEGELLKERVWSWRYKGAKDWEERQKRGEEKVELGEEH